MFWKRKPKSPITTEDETWIVECYHWFEETFERDLSTQEIFLPTKSFLDFDYMGSEDDAIEIVNIIAEKLEIKDSSIEVYFFDEFQPIEFTDEGIYSNYEEGTQLTDGLYSKLVDGIYQIGIESSLLKDPVKLIATAAHELSHIKLIGEERLEENDEPLTDLTASLFGFVIFMANSSIGKMTTWSGNTHMGWQIGGGSGYLHYKLYAFLIAFWMTRRNEKNPDWLNYLDKEILNTVRKSAKYLASKGN
ncbi:MAG: hypothetical protein AAF992_09995 [Bacteroidota bacterium]